MFQKILVTACCATVLYVSPSVAHAASGWSGNLNLVSEYRFRGIDQTWGNPAVQGGVDWTHAAGWYAGTWASNVSRRSYPGGGMELDIYGGYNGKIDEAWSYTAGLYGYVYPGANLRHARCPSAAFSAPCGSLPDQRYDTLEANLGVTWQWLAYKLSVSATDYFGANEKTGYSKGTAGTLYHDLTATVAVSDKLNLILHAGYTDIRATVAGHDPSYTDWRIALSRTFDEGWNASLAAAGGSNDRFYRPPSGGLSATDHATRPLNRPVFMVQLGKTF